MGLIIQYCERPFLWLWKLKQTKKYAKSITSLIKPFLFAFTSLICILQTLYQCGLLGVTWWLSIFKRSKWRSLTFALEIVKVSMSKASVCNIFLKHSDDGRLTDRTCTIGQNSCKMATADICSNQSSCQVSKSRRIKCKILEVIIIFRCFRIFFIISPI